MTPTLIYLRTPLVEDPAAFAPLLRAATTDGAVAAVMLRLPALEERRLVNTVKALAPAAQEGGAAVVVSIEGEGVEDLDLARIARTVADADVIGFQEVERNWREMEHADQVQRLSELFPDRYVFFAPSVDID